MGAPVTTSWAAACGFSVASPCHGQIPKLQRDPHDERGHDDDEHDADEAAAEPYRRPRADVASQQVAGGHDQADLDHDVAARGEDQGAEVGRDVGDLGLRAGLEERVPQQPHQREDEERPGTRTERTVVDADDEPGDHGRHGVAVAAPAQRGLTAELGFEQGVGAHNDETDQHDRVERGLRDVQPDEGADDGPDERDSGHRQGGAQVRVDASVVGHGAGRCPEHRAELVGREDLRERSGRKPSRSAGSWTRPPPPTTASTHPASNAAAATKATVSSVGSTVSSGIASAPSGPSQRDVEDLDDLVNHGVRRRPRARPAGSLGCRCAVPGSRASRPTADRARPRTPGRRRRRTAAGPRPPAARPRGRSRAAASPRGSRWSTRPRRRGRAPRLARAGRGGSPGSRSCSRAPRRGFRSPATLPRAVGSAGRSRCAAPRRPGTRRDRPRLAGRRRRSPLGEDVLEACRGPLLATAGPPGRLRLPDPPGELVGEARVGLVEVVLTGEDPPLLGDVHRATA